MKLYFPTGYMQVYTLVDNFMAGPIGMGDKLEDCDLRHMNDETLGKTYIVDGRSVTMTYGRDNRMNYTGGGYGMAMTLSIGVKQY